MAKADKLGDAERASRHRAAGRSPRNRFSHRIASKIHPMNLLLIGPRASGKTTIGRLLAERLRMKFIDLDQAALAKLGRSSVQSVWKTLGESAWREAEFLSLSEALHGDHQVLALGGGTPMIPQARQIIEHARDRRVITAIYLECSVATLVQRLIENPGDRPSLIATDLASEVEPILRDREPVYRQLADLVWPADRASPSEIADALTKALEAEVLANRRDRQ